MTDTATAVDLRYVAQYAPDIYEVIHPTRERIGSVTRRARDSWDAYDAHGRLLTVSASTRREAGAIVAARAVAADHDARCPDCGEPITLQPSGWWTHDGHPFDDDGRPTCWRSSMDGPGDVDELPPMRNMAGEHASHCPQAARDA